MRFSLYSLFFLVVGSSAWSQSTDFLDEVIKLPEMRVYATRPLPPPEKWTYAQLGNIEVLSSASDYTTRRIIRQYQEFEEVLSVISPAARISAELPIALILCGRMRDFDQFSPHQIVQADNGYASTLLNDHEIASIVIDFARQSDRVDELLPVGAWAAGYTGERSVHTDKEFFREYILLSLKRLEPAPPAWLAEGLARLYSEVDYTNKWINFGEPEVLEVEVSSPSSPPTNSSFALAGSSMSSDTWYNPSRWDDSWAGTMTYLVPQRIIPMHELFSYNASLSDTARAPRGESNAWRRQAGLFVQMCIYGEKGKYREGFFKFVARTAQEAPSEALFKECFGMDYKAMQLQLRSYSTSWQEYTIARFTAKKGSRLISNKPRVELRPATGAEIGRIKGEAFRLAGKNDEAQREFVVAYLRGDRDPALLSSLGLMARQRADNDRARKYLEAVAAATAPVSRPRAYLEVARLRHETIRNPKTPTTQLTAAETASVLQPLFVARNLSPALADVYLEIAATWEASAAIPSRANLGAIEFGVRLFPLNGNLIYRAAALLVRHGYRTDAAPLVEHGLKVTRDQALRAKLQLLRSEIGAPAGGAPQSSFHQPAIERELAPALRERLAAYRATRRALQDNLRAQLTATANLPSAERSRVLNDFARAQQPAIDACEAQGNELATSLGWHPDDALGLALATPRPASNSPGPPVATSALLTALVQNQGLSPPQLSLTHEMLAEEEDAAVPANGAFWFFSPDTARVSLPGPVPAELGSEIKAYLSEKNALKQQLRESLNNYHGTTLSALAIPPALAALAEKQAPHFVSLEQRAETIRAHIATLPSRAAGSTDLSLPTDLATRIAEYQTTKRTLQAEVRATVRELRKNLPVEVALVATNDPPRLELSQPAQLSTAAAAQVTPLKQQIENLNRNYAQRFATLAATQRTLRDELSRVSAPARGQGKSVDDLMNQFSDALEREANATPYQDYRYAVFTPGLSPAQRRLLFDSAGERYPSVIVQP